MNKPDSAAIEAAMKFFVELNGRLNSFHDAIKLRDSVQVAGDAFESGALVLAPQWVAVGEDQPGMDAVDITVEHHRAGYKPTRYVTIANLIKGHWYVGGLRIEGVVVHGGVQHSNRVVSWRLRPEPDTAPLPEEAATSC